MVSRQLIILFFLLTVAFFPGQQAKGAEVVHDLLVSVPGPMNLTYLPIDLISKIGADTAEGARVKVQYFSGGGVALKEMATRNVDFGVAGMPAAMSLRANGGDAVVLAAISDAPLFMLMVRADLKDTVKEVQDLKGKLIGVFTSSLTVKTVSQQLVELLLKTNGVRPDQVRFIPAGQSWEAQSGMLTTGRTDAIMGTEPIASRLLAENKAYFLVDLSDPEQAKKIPGVGFLHAMLATRSEVISKEPVKVEKMVRIIKRTLQWISQNTPEQIVEKLEIKDAEEKRWILAALHKYPKMYSPDGRLSTAQLHEAERFFRESSPEAAASVTLDTLVNDRWAGKKE